MIVSTPFEFAALELNFDDDNAVLTFEVLGSATQRIVDALQEELLPMKAVLQANLQNLWARIPIGMVRSQYYLNAIS